MNFTKGKVTH